MIIFILHRQHKLQMDKRKCMCLEKTSSYFLLILFFKTPKALKVTVGFGFELDNKFATKL